MQAPASERDIASDAALESLLEQAPDDYARVELLVSRARQLQRQQPQQAAVYAQRALELSQRSAYPKGIADAALILGYADYADENYDRAIENIEHALTTYQKLGDRNEAARAATALAGSYFKLGRYDKALLHLNTALTLRQEAGDKKLTASVHTNIASTYQAIGQLDLALDHYLKALELQEAVGDHYGVAITANNIGSVYYQLGHYETALHYTEQALSWLTHQGRQDEVLVTLGNLGRIYLKLGRPDDALTHLSHALHQAHQLGSDYHVATTIYLIGQAHHHRGDYPTALSHMAMALALFRRINADSDVLDVLSSIARCYRDSTTPKRSLRYYKQAIEIARQIQSNLVEAELCEEVSCILEQMGHFQTALAFYRRGTELRRKVLAEDTEKLVSVMEIRHRIERDAREKEIYRLRNVELANALAELQDKTAALQEAYAELEQQQQYTAAINAQLQQANERLHTLDRERSELLSIVTHDLKNLVASIKLSAEVLRHPKTVAKPDVLHKTVSRILEVADSMQHLISSLLDVSALEAGRLAVELVPLAVHPIAQAIIERYQPHAESKRISLLSSIEPAWVIGDKVRIQEIIDNLVSNAVKYTPQGGEVRMLLARRGTVVRLVVSDTGPGFTDEDKQHLFTKFRRLSARPTGGESSTGLGLAIVKKLVELMHGTIWLESTKGEGAIFYVELPATDPPPQAP
ncbi:MAG: hypothetical protein KatS3mg039_0172 [Candidatus Kapaibacterium sp.]|nr:MAG: hypothetical protein KatS3mg039_0172 [Candidatus Kapabacteria bacterium]